MKSKIYILEKASRAMNYGIGTYVKQLTNCLLSSKMDFCVIHLYADCLETTIIDKGGYQQISIPTPYSILLHVYNIIRVMWLTYSKHL